jgi:hypothetical protein
MADLYADDAAVDPLKVSYDRPTILAMAGTFAANASSRSQSGTPAAATRSLMLPGRPDRVPCADAGDGRRRVTTAIGLARNPRHWRSDEREGEPC